MKVLILGAGVVGVSSAWYLSKAGHEVTVVDRQPDSGLETSFANGGQISVSHAEPWSNPHAPLRALSWMGREDAPLLFRLRCDPALFDWSWRFLRECPPGRTRENIRDIVRLAIYSRDELGRLREETGIRYEHLQRGILHVYTNQKEFEGAIEAARIMREFGCERYPIDADKCVEIEPALRASRPILVGGDYTAADESGDALVFTQKLAELCRARGVAFRFGTTVERLTQAGGRVSGVIVGSDSGRETLHADAYVVALGSYSPLALRPLGVRVPVYPAKGYSATIPLSGKSIAPTVAMTDDGHKIVFSRLGQRLRVAGTAEFNGYNTELNDVRCKALMTRTHQLFPELSPAGEPEFWCGLRPSTPSNVPFVGAAKLPNLFLNTGHGTLGWTMACGSGRVLADIVSGRTPEVALRRF
ncbi:MAG: D-amino acid dehydrogenase [Propionivibrio sp.]